MRLPQLISAPFPAAPARRFKPVCLAAVLALSSMAFASSNGLVISQVYGGGGATSGSLTYKSDYVELFNAGSAAVSLSGLSLQYASGTGTGNFSANTVVPLPNVAVQPGQYFLVSLATSATVGGALPVTVDFVGSTGLNISATAGKLALVNGTSGLACNGSSTVCTSAQLAQIVDLVGYGSANFYEGSGAAPAPSTTTAVLRANTGCSDTDVNASDFAAGAPSPRNTATTLVTCSGSGGSGGTGGGSGAPLTAIHSIQGNGGTSPLLGQTVSTSGVVTKVSNNGFFLQDPNADSDPATSEGIFVFTSTTPTVSVGQALTLSGKVAEFNTGAATNTLTASHTVTELTSPTSITVVNSGNSIAPTVITLPATQAQLEALEGMLVTINTQLTASQNYFLGRYGQVTLAANGRLEKPTNKFRPGSADALNMASGNAQRQILLDDGSSLQNPNPTPYIGADNTLRAGDTVDGITGVIDYGLATSDNTGLASYKIHPTTAVAFTRANQRSAQPADVGGNLRVASANLLNFFTTFGDGRTASNQTGQGCAPSGTTADCRGADSAAEFTRQRSKLIAELSAMNADVIGLMELQNNVAAVQNLVDGLNSAMGAGTYDVVPDPASGVGTDAIKVGIIYKPAKVSRVGASLSDTDPTHKRPSVAQTFAAPNGEQFAVVVNHFKSKGSCPTTEANLDPDQDQGDGQGCFNATRVAEATAIQTFVSNLQASTGNNRVVLLGDFNAYSQEDPIYSLVSNGYTDLAARFSIQPYSYVFDGEAGALDHAVATPAFNSLVTSAIEWHVNADEPFVIDYNLEFKQPACAACGPDYYTATPYRSSDHDPLLIGLNLVHTINGTSRSETIVGTPGDDRITGGAGADVITGGAGRDVFVYTSLRDALDTLTDFTPGEDRIDLSAVAASLRASAGSGTDLIAAGFIQLVDTSAGLEIQIDSDGYAGTAGARTLVRLQGVTRSQLQTSRDLMQ
ncbi:MAG: ExeM/NucH family extracellular endonuclease [Aquabacterium sp.]|uniref:ExeM/NucH family extracellular endonuclease n=1 Tax=Aquabacterium sp. TaxID=1872578 RepID=UPI0025B9DEAA|nr:ExeM/NucH family extracellular endonuclease [Aquabacterium sp.]MBI3381036.1 ExeM/NucH family extracellular endonuclease [Aquabacterium sp.]